MLDLSQYYKAQPFIDSTNSKNNTLYYWVQRLDDITGRELVENIYDVENDRFILKEWITDAGHGLINGDNVNLTSARYDEEKKQIVCLYNSVNVKDGKLLYNEWLNGQEWLEKLKKRDIIA